MSHGEGSGGLRIGKPMRKRQLAYWGICSCLLLQAAEPWPAQDDPTHLRVNVVLVQLSVAVTDNKGNYVTGLRPEDFVVTEDKIPQKVSTLKRAVNRRLEPTRSPGGAGPGGPVMVRMATRHRRQI